MTQNNVISHLNRGARTCTRTCASEIEKSNRCRLRLYGNIKEVQDTELYLRQQCNCDLRQGLGEIKLSSHKFFY